MRPNSEIDRLAFGPSPSEIPQGFDVEGVIAHCPGNAEVVLLKCKEVLQQVLTHSENWPESAQWNSLLSLWFIEKCGVDKTREESDLWRKWLLSLPHDEQITALQQEKWSVNSWVFWFNPENGNRQWKWWNASVLSENLLRIEIEVDDWPVAWGALEWLLRAAGADRAEAE